MQNAKIIYLSHSKIDKQLWDTAINNSLNGNVYALSWYLDIVSPDWEALIIGNYEYVFPLTKSKKASINYILQPYFTQQLGVFSANKINGSIIELFINNIPQKFKYIDINLNEGNILINKVFTTKPNTLLNLNKQYSLLAENYNKNTKRNIKKAEKNNLEYSKNVSINEYKILKQECISKNSKKIPYSNLYRIIEMALEKNICKIIGTYCNKKLCSAIVFINSNNRIIYLNACSNKIGIENKAMFLTLDTFIKSNTNSNLIIDFEGSSIPGVSRFFKGFGGTEVNYFNYKINNLPKLLKLVKK